MLLQAAVPGLASLQSRTLGAPSVTVAVLDGPVDLAHPVLRGASLRLLDTLVGEPAGGGRMSRHGTHVTSLVFGRPGSAVPGAAPGCSGLVVPVFADGREDHLPQLDLARAIEQAVLEGAHVINISGGQSAPTGEADHLLQKALELCEAQHVLVVAAAGNDGCACLHVPAAVSTVLAVGALGRDARPLPISNYGELYRTNGVVAPGEDLTGAVPGGGTADMTGTSFATPVVAGVAALLLSLQAAEGAPLDPLEVGAAILGTAAACRPTEAAECQHFLAGALDIPRAVASLTAKKKGGRRCQTSMGPRTLLAA